MADGGERETGGGCALISKHTQKKHSSIQPPSFSCDGDKSHSRLFSFLAFYDISPLLLFVVPILIAISRSLCVNIAFLVQCWHVLSLSHALALRESGFCLTRAKWGDGRGAEIGEIFKSLEPS
jgi:hypothetical protein